MFSAPSFALGVIPPSYKSNSTPPFMSGSGVRSREVSSPSLRPQTAVNQSQSHPTSFVPSAAAVASSIRLVRAIYVGPDAAKDGVRRESASFLQPISRAVIFEDDNHGKGHDARLTLQRSGGCTGESVPELEGWTPERGRLVRTFRGEIPLREDVRPSFLFSHFVLKVRATSVLI
jgi:hypothetical protein